MQLLSIPAWGDPCYFRERAKEIGIITEAALESNTVQAFISKHLLTCEHYTPVEDIIIYTAVCKTCKLM